MVELLGHCVFLVLILTNLNYSLQHLRLAFFAFLRKGEIKLLKGNDSYSKVGISNVRLKNNQLFITMKFLKTDQLGKGTTVVLNSYVSFIYPVKCMLSFFAD